MIAVQPEYNIRRMKILAVAIVAGILLFDQIVKIWVKTHMFLGQEYRIADWFIIHFTENNGMAFGLEFGGTIGKTILSVFRIVASFGIGWYLNHLIVKRSHPGLIVCFSLIFAGAIGNIIDSAFYGLIFSDSINGVARLFPAEGGYSSFLHGRVVDMLYFPLIDGTLPEWLPVWGGDSFQFFRPIFNIADSSISVGVMLFLLRQKTFSHHHRTEQPLQTNGAVE
jgi:signal peptidase II